MKKYCVYLLISLHHDYRYVGMTTSAPSRLRQHDNGLDRATAHYRPFRMIILRSSLAREQARRSERYFKSGHGRQAINRMLEHERHRGRWIVDAEKEGFLPNPFAQPGIVA